MTEFLKERIILGIDPGTTIMGYGIIKGTGNKPMAVDMGVVKMKRLNDPYLKLQEIFKATTLLIHKYSPDELAIEAPFYGKNVQSMLKLGRAQGVAIAAALQHDIPIFEYAPRKIKMAITGQGAASKEQVAAILKNILSFTSDIKDLDATDALAAALCHFYQKSTFSGDNYRGWGDFIKKNPGKTI
ncbi:MAG: crossover junction endodeoxyribonuclease RuvC [Bacteroidales bacterium]|nr:crossover junction endodeoxyribonuclease RuvC [Bacteroidales bacterium]